MTPQLQQAIRLLQLSSLELQTEIQDALESNMMLELEEEQDAAIPGEDARPAPVDRPSSHPLNGGWRNTGFLPWHFTGSSLLFHPIPRSIAPLHDMLVPSMSTTSGPI